LVKLGSVIASFVAAQMEQLFQQTFLYLFRTIAC